MTYPGRPLPADYVRRAMIEIRDSTRPDYPIELGVLGALIGVINRYVGGEMNRRAILGYLFRDGREPMSSHDLTGPEFAALYRWSKITKMPDSGKWVPADKFFAEELQFVALAANAIAETARENPPAVPEPPAGFGVDPVDNSKNDMIDFKAFADQLELFVLRGR